MTGRLSRYKMVREDIITGLKNAIERGYSIDTAVSSFINSGYKKDEVTEAAAYLGNVSAIAPSKTITPQIPAIQTPIQGAPTETIPQQAIGAVQQKPKKSKKGIILVVALAIILLALVGVLAYLIFFKKLFGQ